MDTDLNQPDYSIVVCACLGGPHLGAHRAGDAETCIACERMTPVQHAAIINDHPAFKQLVEHTNAVVQSNMAIDQVLARLTPEQQGWFYGAVNEILAERKAQAQA